MKSLLVVAALCSSLLLSGCGEDKLTPEQTQILQKKDLRDLTKADREELKKMGVSEIYALTDIAPSAEYAMAHPAQLLQELAQRFAKEHFPGM